VPPLGDFVKYFEKWLPNNVEKDSTVFVYYSGHGAPDTKPAELIWFLTTVIHLSLQKPDTHSKECMMHWTNFRQKKL